GCEDIVAHRAGLCGAGDMGPTPGHISGERHYMHKPLKYVDKAISVAAGAAFDVMQFFNKYRPNPSFTPKWSDKPLLKSWQKTKPPLGWPRTTDSLCPKCVIEARKKILDGEVDYRILINEKVGEIKATILERDGQSGMT